MSPEITIEVLKKGVKAPQTGKKAWADRTDPQLVRFGLQWKVYDMVAEKGLGFRLPILEPLGPRPYVGCYLLGGVSGTDYLVQAAGLIQPAPTKGVVLPGVTLLPGPRPPLRTIRYKTLGDLQSIDLHLQLQSIIIPSRIRKAEREPGSAQPGRRHSPSPVSASDLGVGQSAGA